ALHNEQQDQAVVAEAERMPAAASTELRNDPDFLTLLGGAQAATGHNDQAVELLREGRTRYQARGAASPIDLDVQIAWTMMASREHQKEGPALLAETGAGGISEE